MPRRTESFNLGYSVPDGLDKGTQINLLGLLAYDGGKPHTLVRRMKYGGDFREGGLPLSIRQPTGNLFPQ